MFEEIDFYPQEALGVLSIEKLLHNHLGAIMGTPIDEDYLYECMYEAIAEIAQDVADGFPVAQREQRDGRFGSRIGQQLGGQPGLLVVAEALFMHFDDRREVGGDGFPG